MRLIILTGTSGSGKSTMKDRLKELLDPGRFVCMDGDDVGLNWWDYAGTEKEARYGNDCLQRALAGTDGKDLIYASCMTPQDYMTGTDMPDVLGSTYFIALWAPDEVIRERLLARPPERGFTTEEAIRPHLEYNRWIGRNRGKYQLFVDNAGEPPEKTAELLAAYVNGLPD